MEQGGQEGAEMLGDEVGLVLGEVGQVEHREVEEAIETEDLNTKCNKRVIT